jgi:hypothetical protein
MALLIGIFSFLILCAVIAIFSCWWIRKSSTNTNAQTYERLQEHTTTGRGRAAVEQPPRNVDSNEDQCPEVRPVSIEASVPPIIQIPEAIVASEDTIAETYGRLQEHTTTRIGRAAVVQDSNEDLVPEVRAVSIFARVIPEAVAASEVPEAKVIRALSQQGCSDTDVESNQEC